MKSASVVLVGLLVLGEGTMVPLPAAPPDSGQQVGGGQSRAVLPPAAADALVPPDALPANWLAFVYDYGSPFFPLDEKDVNDHQALVVVLDDGTVIWNDTTFDPERYYPAGDARSSTRINPEAWRQGRADPERLRAFRALVNESSFFTAKATEDRVSITDQISQRVGVRIGSDQRVVSKYALEAIAERGKDASDFTRRLYALYAAVKALRPAAAQRYVPGTIRVSVWEIKRGEVGKARVVDWQEGATAGAPDPAQMSRATRGLGAYTLVNDGEVRAPSTYVYLTGAQATAVTGLAARSATVRYQKKLYRLKWSPALRAPQG